MRLGRVIGHFGRQDWAAIAIEFVIVVAGVFLGLQVNNWNEDRVEAKRARTYLERIHGDLTADVAAADRSIAFYTQVQSYAKAALACAEHGKLVDDSPWKTLLAFYQAGQIYPNVASDATYREMTSVGALPLIRSQPLSAALGTYYATRGQSSSQLFSQLPEYRQTIRGLTPSVVQDYIWANCYRQTTLVTHGMVDCAPGVPEDEARAVLDGYRANPALLSQLRYWNTQVRIMNVVSATERSAAEDLARQVAAEFGDQH